MKIEKKRGEKKPTYISTNANGNSNDLWYASKLCIRRQKADQNQDNIPFVYGRNERSLNSKIEHSFVIFHFGLEELRIRYERRKIEEKIRTTIRNGSHLFLFGFAFENNTNKRNRKAQQNMSRMNDEGTWIFGEYCRKKLCKTASCHKS